MSNQDTDTEDGQGDQATPEREGMTPEAFGLALSELGWKATDFCRKAGIVPNTAWRWRKGHAPIPLWVGEYLGAILEIQRLHARFVSVK